MPLALIVGAGIGGLAAGIALRRGGWDVRIFERAEAPRELGFGIGLAPNAMAALHELGVASAVLPQAFAPSAAEVRHVDGRVIRRFEAGSWRLPAGGVPRMILRPALHGALLAAVGSGSIEVNSEATAVESDGGRVRLRLANRTSFDGDMVVGADGVQSAIRSQLHPREPPPRPSGYIALRGASPAVDRLDGLQAIWYFGPGVESGVVQASATTIYWFLSLCADAVASGPSDAVSVLRRFGAPFDAQFHAISGATRSEDLRVDELFERDPLRQWGAGRVTLLGDAAHPMLPHTGQGAAQALEDAVGLGRAVRNAADPIAALRRYEAVRSACTRRVVRSGPRIARVTTTTNPVVAALRNAAVRLVPEAIVVRAFTRPPKDANLALGPPSDDAGST